MTPAPQPAALGPSVDLLGIGAGPANLSVAALAWGLPGLRTRFIDRQETFRWHGGLMLPSSKLQVSHLKDLVTLVDPTSRFTYLNFLAQSGRLQRFASLGDRAITRREYESYLRWVGEAIDVVEYGRAVREVSFDGDAFRATIDDGAVVRARHLSVAIGSVPCIPGAVAGLLGPTMLHASRFCEVAESLAGRSVAVVGGGQSGAELVDHLLGMRGTAAPSGLTWVNRRPSLHPLDDSPFINEWFHPDYVRYFHALAPGRRMELLDVQRMASDGVSVDLLERIYQRLYENDFVDPRRIPVEVLPGRELVRATAGRDGWCLELVQTDTGATEDLRADIVVLATGYRFEMPDFLAPIAHLIPPSEGRLPLGVDYSLPWDGPRENKLFFLNAGRNSHGIADPNLSLGAWRAATVLAAITPTPWSTTPSSGVRSSASRWGREPLRVAEPLHAEGLL